MTPFSAWWTRIGGSARIHESFQALRQRRSVAGMVGELLAQKVFLAQTEEGEPQLERICLTQDELATLLGAAAQTALIVTEEGK